MTDSTHTPGPWYARGTRIMSAGQRMEFCPDLDVTVVECRGAMGGDDSEADTRLIAAAPDLLDVARRVADYFEHTNAPLGIAAREAIAKATIPE